MYVFDRDLLLIESGTDSWTAAVSDRWNIGSIPNGGYVLAMAMAAFSASGGHPDPLTVTAHYYRRLDPQTSADIDLEHVRRGRTTSSSMVRISQNGRECVRVLGTYGDLDGLVGPTTVRADPPAIPDPEDCVATAREDAPFALTRQVELRVAPEYVGGMIGEPSGIAEMAGWIRFWDGREPDLHSLALFVDSFPPTIMNLNRYGWVPTLELTVHFRAKPAPGWLAAKFSTRFLIDGLFEEDGELWDSTGRLVAHSRQLAKVLVQGS